MPLTAEERAEINRRNALKSTGPKTPEGKAASRRNAVRHGLRVETLAIPTENPDELQALAERWHGYYQPDSPAEEELVDSAVYAIVQRRRGARHLSATITRQVRAAEVAFDQASREEIDRLGPLFFGPTPFEAVLQAKRTAAGCRFLLNFWDQVAEQFDRQGFFNPDERDILARLLGASPEDWTRETMAYLVRIYGFLCQPKGCPKSIAWMMEARNIPARLRDTMALWTPTETQAREWFAMKIRDGRAELEALEECLRLEIEEPDRADAAARAALLVGPDAALMLRYNRMHESAFHRAYSALLKGRKESGRPLHQEVEPPAPNEAKAAAPNETKAPAPNEANPGRAGSAHDPQRDARPQVAEEGGNVPSEQEPPAPNEARVDAPSKAMTAAPNEANGSAERGAKDCTREVAA